MFQFRASVTDSGPVLGLLKFEPEIQSLKLKFRMAAKKLIREIPINLS